MKLLLHCCCGPCGAEVASHFRGLGYKITGWFFNPNIHPPEEARRRRETLVQAAERTGFPLASPGEEMPFDGFLAAIGRTGGVRCRACYRMRLEATARKAAAEGFQEFSSTLLISPYQDLEAISEVGREAAARHGVRFRYEDLRGKYHDSCERARELGLYRQNYCGCLFSSLERSERRCVRALGEFHQAPRG